jgi:hypothetical protein
VRRDKFLHKQQEGIMQGNPINFLNHRFSVAATCALFLVIGCSKGELTRSSATDLISHSSKFSPKTPSLELSSAELQCGLKEGWWGEAPRHKPNLDSFFAFHLQVTPKGKSAFGKLSSSYSSGHVAQVTLNKEYSRTVTEVTGIADFTPPLEGWAGKEVRFNWQWNWDQLPEMAKRCLTPRPQQAGTVAFRRYDDGWRVERFDLD